MPGRRKRNTQRLFIALDPPFEVADAAARWGREIGRSSRGLRSVPSRNAHLTLAFLGERGPGELEPIAAAMRSTVAPVDGLSLGAPIWLPKRHPRALALEIHDERGELAEVQGALAQELGHSIGWVPEHRHFRPHLTVARVGRGADVSRVRLPVGPSAEFGSEAITLYSSTLTPEGARYEALLSLGDELD